MHTTNTTMLSAGEENLQVGVVGVVLVEDWPLDAELVTRDTEVTPVGAVAAATSPIQLQPWQIWILVAVVPALLALPASTLWAIGMAIGTAM